MIPLGTEDFAVHREGNEIIFSGRTKRAVLYAAYEFLYRQGVRWVAGDAHGGFVPPKGRIDLSVLPIRFRPPFATRLANYPVREIPPSKTDDGFLWNIRHHINCTWNSLKPTLGGSPPRQSLGFGYAHTMNSIIPEDVLKQHRLGRQAHEGGLVQESPAPPTPSSLTTSWAASSTWAASTRSTRASASTR